MYLLKEDNIHLHGVVSLKNLSPFNRGVQPLHIMRHNGQGRVVQWRVSHGSEWWESATMVDILPQPEGCPEGLTDASGPLHSGP